MPQTVMNWEGHSILVVEDDQMNYNYLDVLLKPTKARVLHARDGEMAIELCEQHPGISVVLMDLRLPLLNGLEAAKQILGFRRGLPIIAQTAYAREYDREQALDAGCCDFIAKPVRANEMLELIRKYIE
jgi:two-component system, cell cycle response regulator DivK